MRFLSPMQLRALFVSLAAVCVVPQLVAAQSPPANRNAPHQRPPAPPVDQEQFVSYWTSETGWKSELQLRNNAAGQDLTVTPVLRLPNGTETPLSPVTIKPQEVKSIDLDTAIAAAAAPQLLGTYGSVVLRYRSPSSATLYAAMMIRKTGNPIAFHIDAMGESQDFQSGGREGIWWLPKDSTSDYLLLTNQGKTPIPLNLSLYDASGKERKQNVLLGPGATSRYSVRELVQAAGLAGSYGGLKISANAHAGSLDTLHFLFDESAGFSAILKMFDYNPNAKLEERDHARTGTWTLRAPMLALSNPDLALAFPPGTTLQPQLFVRNATAKFIDAALRFNWRAASTTGKSPPGPTLRLSPFETRRIDVAALQDGKTLPANANWTSVTVTTNSKPDELMAVAASYDTTLRYGAQTPFSDQLSFKWEGGMWEYDPYHSSIITAGNGGTKPTQAAFTIFYNQGTQRYDLEQTLQPDEQMWVDVGKLIRQQVPDKNGKTLPSDLTMGSYEIRDLTNKGVGTLFEGKVIYDKTYGHAAYGCAGCCGYTTTLLWYDPLGIPLLSTAGTGVDAYDTCIQAYDDVTNYFLNNWSTANTSIATVNTTGTHTGVSEGSTTSITCGYLDGSSPRSCPIVRKCPSGGDNVMSFTGVLTASDNFSGRSSTRFGIGETIQLSYTASPTGTTAASLGGLQWSIVSGGGSLTGAGTDGMGTYTAPGNQATAVLRLAVVSGSLQGQYHDYSISIIPPNGGLESKFSNIRHTQGYESVGFEAHVYLEPTDVSFANLQFAEGTTTATASGFFAASNGQVHPPTNPPMSIGSCDSVLGCEVNATDTIDSGNNPPPFSVGDFLWQIPWQYKSSTGSLTAFTIVYHHETADATGQGTIEKGGAGPFSKNASDPTSSY